jgi:HlyD family secretion protein
MPSTAKSSNKLRIAVIAGLAVAGTAGAIIAFASPKKVVAKFETTPIDKGKLTARVTATGTLNAIVTVLVSSQVSGRIQEVLVDYNAVVKKGQLLARIDPAFFEASMEQAKANLIAATANAQRSKVQAEDALRQAERTDTLFARSLIAEAERDTARTAAQAAQAQVTASEAAIGQARASLNQAKVNLEYTNILSPVSGVVISRAIDPGATVAASLSAPTLFTIAEDLRKMQVEASVAESDVGRIQEGMAASFLVDAFPSRRFNGKVRQVRNAPITQQGVVTYTTVVDVQNEDLALRPGMTANVTFIYAERDEVMKVPNAAFRYRPALDVPRRGGAANLNSTTRTIYVEREGAAVAVQVTAGISDGSSTEVSGDEVKPGDLVILENKEDSRPGAGGPPGGPPGGGGRRLF